MLVHTQLEIVCCISFSRVAAIRCDDFQSNAKRTRPGRADDFRQLRDDSTVLYYLIVRYYLVLSYLILSYLMLSCLMPTILQDILRIEAKRYSDSATSACRP